MIEFVLPAWLCVCFFFPYSKITQYEQDLKHLYHELRSKEIFLTKVKIWSFFRKILELEEELKVVGNNMKSLEVSEQEVVLLRMFDTSPYDLCLCVFNYD